MQPELKNSTQTSKTHFIRGMTLQQYISNIQFIPPSSSSQQPEKQQNFIQNTLPTNQITSTPKHHQRFIQEVKQESNYDSRDSVRFNFPQDKNTDQRTKQTFREGTLADSSPYQKQGKEQFHRNTAYFQGHHSFRIKHVSYSPSKKHFEKLINPSLTLFGHKLKTTKGQPTPVQELLTFYGKSARVDKCVRDNKCDSKANGHLNLQGPIDFQKKVSTNFNQKVFLRELKIQGLKDKLVQRRNKFC